MENDQMDVCPKMKWTRKLKKMVAMTSACCLIFSSVITTQAAALKDIFDAKSYTEEYSDLKTAYGTNEKALYNHYLSLGIAEKRHMNELIDLPAYKEANPDLQNAFGNDWNAYFNHYITYGAKEGRNNFTQFDAIAYSNRYPDVKAAYGTDILALYKHFIAFGKAERRDGGRYYEVSNTSSSQSTPTPTPVPTPTPTPTPTPDPDQTPVEVRGVIIDPETNQPIGNANVQAARLNNGPAARSFRAVNASADTWADSDVVSVSSNDNGEFVFPELVPGTYKVSVNAEGYMELTMQNLIVYGGETNYLERVTVLNTVSSGDEELGGSVTDATTGLGLEGVTITLHHSWSNTTGEPAATITTDAEGKYQSDLPRGYYTAVLSKAGYITMTMNVVSLSGYSAIQQNVSISPEMSEGSGDYRVVLSWGENPRDLDSHLTGRVPGLEEDFHVYYGDREAMGGNGDVIASLDVDDVTSYGPETITVFSAVKEGIYRYSVYDYTNGGEASSTALSSSGAVVSLYKGAALVKSYQIPTNKQGDVWNVFEIRNDELITINDINGNRDTIEIPN